MFERFTDRARRVMVLAQEEARMLQHNYIGTEHLLLGLLVEGQGVGTKALVELGITKEAAIAQIKTIIGQGQLKPSGHIPFTPRAKKVLELGLREALQLGHNYIGTEHILLALIREGEGVAAQILVKLGADLLSARKKVLDILAGQSEASIKRGMHIVGLRNHDEQWSRMKAVYDTCMSAHVDVPPAVTDYFKTNSLDSGGPEVDLKALTIDWQSDLSIGMELDLSIIPAGVTKLRFYLK